MRRYPTLLIPVTIVALLLALGFPALRQYNVTWDEALGDFFFGERYLSFFLSFDTSYLDFDADPYPPGRSPDLSVSPFRDRPWEYYPAANLLAAATSTVFSRYLGLLDPFDGFHALNLLLAALLVPVFFSHVQRTLGSHTAAVATLLLLSSPRLVAHLMANIKDFPLLVFFTLTLITFVRAWQTGSRGGLLATGLLWGVALATKANALFLPLIALLLVLVAPLPRAWLGRRRQLWISLSLAALGGLFTTFALWPYLWSSPIERLGAHLAYIGFRTFETRPESVASPLAALLLTTPVPLLLLFVIGLYPVLQGCWRREAHSLLPLLWLAIVGGRLYLPNAVNFDGVRHFLEILPAMAIVAGAGYCFLDRRLRNLGTPRSALPLRLFLTLALLAPGAIATVRSHPLGLAYWNGLAGGLEGARAAGYRQAGDYWGTSYRLGLRWLNENAPPGAVLAVPLLQHAVTLVAPERLRADIGLLDISRPEVPDLRPGTEDLLRQVSREVPVYVMFVLRSDWTNELTEDCRHRLDPAAEWSVDGAPVLQIYRWHP